jgi:hypothetical protein
VGNIVQGLMGAVADAKKCELKKPSVAGVKWKNRNDSGNIGKAWSG